jgi:glycosyltransferase involved in cell wall biosynthesis
VTPHEPIAFERRIFGRIYRRCDLVIAHSGHDRDRLIGELGVAPERVTVIPHGEYGFFASVGAGEDRAAARGALGLGSEDEVVLFFGYVRRYKGLDLLLEAWPRVAAERPSARLLIAGDPARLGPETRAELEVRSDELGAIRRFEYIPVDEVGRYFAAADLLAMPYRHISQSGVLYLALSLGLPVVATRVGGLPELLRDEESALIVPPESPPDLARAIVRALADPSLRARLGSEGLRLAREHSWPAVAGWTEAAFEPLIGDQRERS